MPAPESENVQRLLQAVWDLFDLEVGWPTVGQVANHLDRRHDLVFEDVLTEVPSVLLYGVHPNRMPADQETVGLTLAGAATAEGSTETLRLVVDAVRLAADIQREWEPPTNERGAEPMFTAADLIQKRMVPVTGRPVLLARVGALLQSESWGWTGAGHATRDAWSFSLGRRLRRFRDVADLADLWDRTHPTEPVERVPTTDLADLDPGRQMTAAAEDRTRQIFHVQLTKGSGFTGTRTDTWWDLDEAGLEEKVLRARRDGRAVWRSGTEYSWPETRVQIFEGPPTTNIPNFSILITPALLAMTEQVRDVTDHWITGPAGVTSQAIAAVTAHRRFQVFLSSTFVDLQQERVAVTQELLQMGRCIPAGMELFGASSLPPWDVITRVLDVTDYLVLVLGHRYGSVPPGGGLSYTEREYDYALAANIPILAFVSDPTRPVPPQHVETDSEAQKALARFRQKVQNAHTVTRWSNPEDLKVAVINALYKAMSDTPRPGWVRGSVSN